MSPRIMAAMLILVLHLAPEDPTQTYMIAVVEFCAEIYGIDAKLCRCVVSEESRWNPNAKGDKGMSVGLWQWKERSIRYAFDDMGIVWDWKDGDPRLSVWASSLAACHAISQGWDWWTTQEMCKKILATVEFE